MKYFGRIFLLLGCVALVSSQGAAAPIMADDESVVAQLQAPGDEVARLDQIVITPTGTEVGQRQTSVSVSTVTRQDIEARQAVRVDEVLREVPGVVISQTGATGGLTSLFLRGGNSNMTQVLLNGFRLNDVGGGFDFSKLTTDNVERVEVVRGPMSSLYGSDAMTGVVNIISRKGEGRPSLTLTSNWGAHAEGHSKRNLISEQRLNFQGAWRQVAWSVGYSTYYDYGILPLNNRQTANVLNSRLDVSPLEKLTFTFTTLFLDKYFGHPTSGGGDRLDSRVFGGNGLDPDQNSTNNNLLLGLTANYQPWDWWQQELSLGYLNLDSRYNNKANPDQVLFQTYDYFSRDLEDQYSLNYRHNFIFGQPERFGSTTTLGLELRNERWKGWAHSWDWGVGRYSDNFTKASRGSVSYYLQEQLAFYNRFFLTFGGRFEDNSSFDKVEFSPRASAALRFPETDTTLRAAGGRAIKAPSFYQTNSLNPFALGNPALKPEQNVSWEIGVDQWYQDQVQASLTYFENSFTDLIQYIFPSFFNVAKATSKGVELALTLRPQALPGFTVRTAYTYLTDLRVLDAGTLVSPAVIPGQNLLRRPRQTWSFDLNYVAKTWEVNLNGLYVGARSDLGYYPFPVGTRRLCNGGYFIANLAGYYTVANNWGYVKRLQLMARINNLFDKNYTEVFGYSSPRFNIIGGLRLEL
ncbi:MAG: TonB-dependent receptor plug domain-containing protein [Desulfobacca sp.]